MWTVIAALILAVPISFFLIQILIFMGSFLIALIGVFGIKMHVKGKIEEKKKYSSKYGKKDV